MARSQLSILAAALSAGAAITAITMTAVKAGKNDIAFRVVVETEKDAVQTLHDVTDDAGKIRRFNNADDFIKQAGALGMLEGRDVPDVTMANLELVAPKAFTGDIVKKNVSIMGAYVKRKVVVLERITGLTAQIALAGSTPGVPASVVDELTAQKDSVVALAAWLTAEIARIDAIVNPGP